MHGSAPLNQRSASLNGVSQHYIFRLCDATPQKAVDGIRSLMSHFKDERKDYNLVNQFFRKLLQTFLAFLL